MVNWLALLIIFKMTLAVANPDLEVRSGRMVHIAAFTIRICHWTLVQILDQ